ncbi:mitochondrial fission ELM1 family protein [Ameyamaea chiangmaiensis]|nr:mitochondrial fission ELM1 family protein [Ameyamaea chiangmaiensis]
MRAQGFGLVERADLTGQLSPVKVRRGYGLLPARLWPSPLRAVAPLDVAGCRAIVAVGGKSAAVAAALRAPDRPVIQVQNPRMALSKFDLVIANRHDEISGPNVVLTRTALHQVTPDVLAEARAVWAPRLAHLPRPLVACLVGGTNGRYTLDPTAAEVLAQGLREVMEFDRAGLVVTPSRRTDPVVRQLLEERLSPRGAWVWDMTGENPYLGLLACADRILVTIDSVSMISEAVATCAPVHVIRLPGTSRRIELFVRELTLAGRVRLFDGRAEDWPVEPLDDTPLAAAAMRRLLGE